MCTRRCDARFRVGWWPIDPPAPAPPPPPKPAERAVGKINGHPCVVAIWPAARKPPDLDVVWHPYGGGCWVAVRVP